MNEPAQGASVQVVLASSSPRRSELLSKLGIEFEIRSADIDETPFPGELPEALLVRLATQKAKAVSALLEGPAVVLGADTIVVCDEKILGKPADESDAREMLRLLSDRTHAASTGIAVIGVDGQVTTAMSTTLVTMHKISESDIDWYLATGEPFDKAGSYALQGHGGLFVSAINGNMHNVIGLPLDATRQLLVAAGVSIAGSGSGQ